MGSASLDCRLKNYEFELIKKNWAIITVVNCSYHRIDWLLWLSDFVKNLFILKIHLKFQPQSAL